MSTVWMIAALVFTAGIFIAPIFAIYNLIRWDRYTERVRKYGQEPVSKFYFGLSLFGLAYVCYMIAAYCNQQLVNLEPQYANAAVQPQNQKTVSPVASLPNTSTATPEALPTQLGKAELKLIAQQVYAQTQEALKDAQIIAQLSNPDTQHMETPKLSRRLIAINDQARILGLQEGASLGASAEPYGRCFEYASSAQFLWGLVYTQWISGDTLQTTKDRNQWIKRTESAEIECKRQLGK